MFFSFRMSKRHVHTLAKVIAALLMTATSVTSHSQTMSSTPTISLDSLMPELLKADSIDKALTAFKPSVSKSQLMTSDYLLLDSPAIAPAGLLSVHLMSELPGTDLFLLLNATPSKGEPTVLAAQEIPNRTKADIRVKVKLTKSSELLLVVRAGGKWYSAINDIKIATK
ncbi:hypothetical protein H8K38_08225 [Undibacterium sp. FT79W]|nr:hypothetical protein [Undibacterium sp. FT79W]